jgi:outer membrane lipoprotein SlyB
MRMINTLGSALGIIAALILGGCAEMNSTPYPSNPNVASTGNTYSAYGVVHSIELVQQENSGIGGSSIGLGTIAGAVIGGVLGNQVGAGRGNTVATVAGAAGGAYVGHELENRQQQRSDAYKITVRMDDGAYQTLMQSTNSGFRVGDRVRFDNGAMQRY